MFHRPRTGAANFTSCSRSLPNLAPAAISSVLCRPLSSAPLISSASAVASSPARRRAVSRAPRRHSRRTHSASITIFPEGIATGALRAKEVFWSDDVSQEAGANQQIVTRYQARQLLAVPLLGADGNVLGMFGVLDRLDGTGISREDIRRARALAAQVSVVMEVAHNLHQSELNRRRSDVLVQLGREIDGLLRLPDFACKFVERTIELAGARAGALALFQDGRFQTAALHPVPRPPRGSSEYRGLAGVSEDAHPTVTSGPDHSGQDHPTQSSRGHDRAVEPPPSTIEAEAKISFWTALSALPFRAGRQGADAIVSGTAPDLLGPTWLHSGLE